MRSITTTFKYLTQKLDGNTSRRDVLRSLAGGSAATVLATLGLAQEPTNVGAARRRRCKRVQQVCSASRQCCQGRQCLNNGCAGVSVCCSASGGRCAVDCDCCGSSLCNFQTGSCF